MRRLFQHIGTLAGIVPASVRRKEGAAMDEVGTLSDAWLLVDGGRIAAFGDAATPVPPGADEVIDCEGGLMMPAFCDSHTHIVYAGCRDGEFLDKINGLSYEEIAARGGGILNSADLLHKTSEDELKMLRVIDRIKATSPAMIKVTFLGAHAVGRGYTKEDYVAAVCRMMPEAARYADFVDIFCEEGFFTVEDATLVLEAGLRAGLRPKIHANQLAFSGGVQVGAKYGALSVDHLEKSGPAEIEALQDSVTMPTFLPGSSFFLRIPDGPAKDYIAAGLGIALASDYNPGSSPAGDMRWIWSLGCIRMRLTPNQAFNAVTLNSAYAMGVGDQCGSITAGKRADLILTRPGWTLTKIPYLHHTPFIRQVYLQGKAI